MSEWLTFVKAYAATTNAAGQRSWQISAGPARERRYGDCRRSERSNGTTPPLVGEC